MIELRKADPVARRRVLLLVAVAVVIATALILALEQYRLPLRDGFLAGPEPTPERIGRINVLLGALLLTPLLGFAAWLWSLGGRTLRARAFPPPGLRVIRDTRVITGEAAMTRGRRLKLLAAGFGIAGIAPVLLLWRLTRLFHGLAA
ncbi:MAG TPA: hypothetical protein VLS27_17015 [Gammaproteobacteria bacterium]|nr:hypothetical protein [Gammaproteobacteria bacterium]